MDHRRGDYNTNAQDLVHKEMLIVQQILEHQIARQDARIEALYLDQNGKHGLKENITILQQQIASLLCVGKWIAGIIAAMIIMLAVWFFSEQSKTRDAVLRLSTTPPTVAYPTKTP